MTILQFLILTLENSYISFYKHELFIVMPKDLNCRLSRKLRSEGENKIWMILLSFILFYSQFSM